MIDLDDVRRAARSLDGIAHRTPVLRSRTLDERVGVEVFVKAENMQRAGAFKFRGAYNAISSLAEPERRRGIITLSSGNHAQATALAARLVGSPAAVLMPTDCPQSKLAATRSYGAEVVPFDRYAHDFDELLASVAAERRLRAVHAYDDWDVIAGQGTTSLELFEDVQDLEALVVPVGGGGLIAGCSLAAAAHGAEVFGVEPEASGDVRRSLIAGHRVSVEVAPTIADGQMLPTPGEKTFELISRHVREVVTVTDDQIVEAMRFVFERMKVVAEPSGACAIAALLAGKVPLRGRRVGLIVSGGNIDSGRFAELVAGGRPAEAIRR